MFIKKWTFNDYLGVLGEAWRANKALILGNKRQDKTRQDTSLVAVCARLRVEPGLEDRALMVPKKQDKRR